jgi:DUF1365 family protein
MHERFGPQAYRFVYRSFSLLIDIDRIDATCAGLRWLSHNRFNLLSFHDRDFGPGDGRSLRDWVNGLMREQGIAPEGVAVRLLCYPRVLGYQFNPLSAWFCESADGRLLAVICEVHNTFGERHWYFLPTSGTRDRTVRARAAKRMHVSPFIDMCADYRFEIRAPGETMRVLIDEYQAGERLLFATLSGRRRTLDNAGLLACFFRVPLLTFKVIAMIHWRALRIWLSGVRVRRKPPPPSQEVTVAWPHANE